VAVKIRSMNENQIEKHREKFPLPFEEITAYSSFTQILGNKPDDYSIEERKKRWFKNGELLKKVSPEAFEYYFTTNGSNETCFGCIHRNNEENWCKWSELPCNYNPVLKNLGMACMGLGHETSQQLELFEGFD
jgi:hypothetical protein